MPSAQANRLASWLEVASHLRSHVFILTSGSTAASESDYKWVALSHRALIASAEASNQFLQCTPEDVWLHTLPDFHVGGLGIWVRAGLLANRLVRMDPSERWNAAKFAQVAQESGATLCSMVPAQVHDLVSLNLRAPSSLRAIIVGGGALSAGLWQQARDLGWPVLRSYGLSETASQAATEQLGPQSQSEQRLKVLAHLEARQDIAGRIELRGDSLFSGYISLDQEGHPHFWDPKDSDGWFKTEDLGTVQAREIKLEGRANDRIKIGGEISSLAVLRGKFDELCAVNGLGSTVALIAVSDQRLEAVIALVAEDDVDESTLELVHEQFDDLVLPYERIRRVYRVASIPRTELGKLKSAELLSLLASQ